jgi:isoleucyl-tRNA synthetase
VGETYRGIRNALRYQLSNLYDFDPARQTVADDKLTGLDRWILGEFSKLEQEVIAAYDKYEFHVVYQKISQFVAVELSSIYHDVIKDRMYTDPANSLRRRSTQTALHRLVTGLCQMLAPVLAYTADEAWETVPGKKGNSVHEASWENSEFNLPLGEQAEWGELLKTRSQALPFLEEKRREKHIGKSLDAKLIISGSTDSSVEIEKNHIEDLRELLNVSQLAIQSGGAPIGDFKTYSIEKADGQKCERCWHWEMDVGQDPAHPTICARCVEAVKQLKV